ncbi:hypothetical protein [Paraburkholderia susongensis]|uniref:Uncharacterized protein n=1 Tax=Paraburkholderia susongensis TaxID=1515439 RepID=A0A1X7IL97_9BURK|nr:hypothetical protein [Paraburkholderia susongensis]SMG15744.1 hypothetical protein SAMN06265784_101827 [Paraburkholderia susongensis]
MSIVFRITLINRASCFAICAVIAVVIALSTLPAGASAQSAQAVSARSAEAAKPELTARVPTDACSQSDARVPGASGDAASLNDILPGDPPLSQQRGGAPGMLRVAAMSQPMQDDGNQVTLWDEIAPPLPLPVPVDAAHAAQGNIGM